MGNPVNFPFFPTIGTPDVLMVQINPRSEDSFEQLTADSKLDSIMISSTCRRADQKFLAQHSTIGEPGSTPSQGASAGRTRVLIR